MDLAQQAVGVGLEGGEAAAVVPVFGLESAVESHGGDITIGEAEGAVSRRRQRVGETSLRDEAGGGGENATGVRVANRKRHTSYCIGEQVVGPMGAVAWEISLWQVLFTASPAMRGSEHACGLCAWAPSRLQQDRIGR